MDIIYDGAAESGEGALFIRTAIAPGAAPAIFVSRVCPSANIDMTQSFSVHSQMEIDMLRQALNAAETVMKAIHHVPSKQSSQT